MASLRPSSAITDVAGIKVGHYTDPRRPTGCTVVLCEDGAVGGVDVRGSAPGTRETDLLDPVNLIDRVHGVVLSGGSAFGLDAASGVVRYLDERGVGYATQHCPIPIVPAAVIFDLAVGDPKIRPDAAAGYAAAREARAEAPADGNFGAGAGATIGKLFGMEHAMKGGIGSASLKVGGIVVGAIFAVNPVGDVVDPHTGTLVAGALDQDGKLLDTSAALLRGATPVWLAAEATTIGVVATDAQLTKSEAQKLAQMAHDGLARAINPAHTMFDGDTIFALGTGKAEKRGNPTLLGIAAAEAVVAAILRAVHAAASLPGLPAARDLRAKRPTRG